MTPEATAYLARSAELLDRAVQLLRAGFTEDAGRSAYMAGFHAAQALIFERTGRSPKTHSGVHSEFAKLVVGEPLIDLELRAFLGRGYNLKAIADYETGAGASISPRKATEAIDAARSFIGAIGALLPT